MLNMIYDTQYCTTLPCNCHIYLYLYILSVWRLLLYV